MSERRQELWLIRHKETDGAWLNRFMPIVKTTQKKIRNPTWSFRMCLPRAI